jgi:predicted NUDIX family NTP pyrophosphohydrolase
MQTSFPRGDNDTKLIPPFNLGMAQCIWGYDYGSVFASLNFASTAPEFATHKSFCYNKIMPIISAGLLLYRKRGGILQVLLVHPGGPLWLKKDVEAWSIPKGLVGQGEDPLEGAKREFREETGFSASGRFIPLEPVKLKSGKVIRAWAIEGDCDPAAIKSNTFTMEWPPRTGRQQIFPEVDRAQWFGIGEAKQKINQGQAGLLEELEHMTAEKKI